MAKAKYQTEKQRLIKECEKIGVKVSARWSAADMRKVLKEGEQPKKGRPAESEKALKKRIEKICTPEKCICGSEIVLNGMITIRSDKSMMQVLNGNYWDGIKYSTHTCKCGQKLIVRTPIKTRKFKCACGKPALMWDKDGKGRCASINCK